MTNCKQGVLDRGDHTYATGIVDDSIRFQKLLLLQNATGHTVSKQIVDDSIQTQKRSRQEKEPYNTNSELDVAASATEKTARETDGDSDEFHFPHYEGEVTALRFWTTFYEKCISPFDSIFLEYTSRMCYNSEYGGPLIEHFLKHGSLHLYGYLKTDGLIYFALNIAQIRSFMNQFERLSVLYTFTCIEHLQCPLYAASEQAIENHLTTHEIQFVQMKKLYPPRPYAIRNLKAFRMQVTTK